MLQPLKNKIIEAVPEIMELKFGCEVWFKLPHDESRFNGRILKISDTHVWLWQEYMPNDVFLMTKSRLLRYGKILGRKIGIADVLLAIEKVSLPKHLLVLPSGNIYLFESGVLDNPVANWNLKNDDLEKQSPETIKFLTELLCK